MEHFEFPGENNNPQEKIERLKEAIVGIGFCIEETEEGIRIDFEKE